ncbi:MAG: sporulation initiation factor Spo0A C-terminal domain-containing protein [Lachnospiraceae bacterium]|nr:sporulation initiation factor Spo0A C-terminal domain-containing protein [Cuneatibacter sp.]MDD6456424.1 sporulation initiation factor Spo0A C-terminal domain-containing protein [Lachnospiraceae bacterium]
MNMNTLLESFLRSLGASQRYAGYDDILVCLELALQDENRLLHLQRQLYRPTAVFQHTNISSVKRNMDTLVWSCWRKRDPRVWDTISGCHLKSCPTLGEFLELSVCYLKEKAMPYLDYDYFQADRAS